jgi:Cysteine-rich CPXCG
MRRVVGRMAVRRWRESATSKVPMRKRKKKARAVATAVACPFCGEVEDLFIDAGGGDRQVYTEDCAVCCRPRVVHVEPGDEPGVVGVWLERGE